MAETAGKKAQRIGPRVTVKVGEVAAGKKKGQILYSFMRKATADFFGLKAEPNAVGIKPKKGEAKPVRGSKGGGSIKIPVGSGTAGKPAAAKGGGKVVYKNIPMPSGATLAVIKKFVASFTKNKPTSFVTKDGRSWPVESGTGTTK